MKKIKENPLMGNQKRIKSISVGSEDENIIKKFVIIVLIIILLASVVYFVTEHTKDKKNNDDTIVSGEINYDILTIGMLLNRPEKEYYVIIYDGNSDDAILYSAMLSTYKAKKDHVKIYFCDLNNKLNSNYYNVGNDNKSNPKATKIDELDLGDLTLLKVNNGKITKYVEKYDEIKNILK